MTQVSEDAAFVRYPPPALSQRASGFQPLLLVKVAGPRCEALSKSLQKSGICGCALSKSWQSWERGIHPLGGHWPSHSHCDQPKHSQATKPGWGRIFRKPLNFFQHRTRSSIHQLLKISWGPIWFSLKIFWHNVQKHSFWGSSKHWKRCYINILSNPSVYSNINSPCQLVKLTRKDFLGTLFWQSKHWVLCAGQKFHNKKKLWLKHFKVKHFDTRFVSATRHPLILDWIYLLKIWFYILYISSLRQHSCLSSVKIDPCSICIQASRKNKKIFSSLQSK